MVKAAVVLLDSEPSIRKHSFSERNYLLCVALQTFGTTLSQPIPSIGEEVPKPIADLIARLIRYRQIVQAPTVETALNDLVVQFLKRNIRPLELGAIRTALQTNSSISDIGDLDDLAKILFFKIQLEAVSSTSNQTAQKIKKRIDQAVADFKAKYQPWPDITQPVWDGDLSVSSPLFNQTNFSTTSGRFIWSTSDTENEVSS